MLSAELWAEGGGEKGAPPPPQSQTQSLLDGIHIKLCKDEFADISELLDTFKHLQTGKENARGERILSYLFFPF